MQKEEKNISESHCVDCENGLKKRKDWRSWLGAGLVLAVVFCFFILFQKLGFLEKFNFLSTKITLPLAFLTGIVASASSCLAVVGSVVAIFSVGQKMEKGSFLKKQMKSNLFFHLGRLMTFFLLGGLLGFVGGKLNIDGKFLSFYLLLIAFVLVWVGLNVLGFLPPISALGIRLPAKVLTFWQKMKNADNQSGIFFLGALTFFLPCGFTQSMQILALASGSFWLGGGLLFFFALGTLPVLFLFGAAIVWAKNRGWIFFQKAVGILLVFSAFFVFNSGWGLLQKKKTENFSQSREGGKKENKVEQIIKMKVTASSFEPNVLKIKAGFPVKWIIQGDKASGCTNKIFIPSLGIEKNISSGENVIEFNSSKKSGEEISFSCWMGMVRGKFVVE